MSIEFVYNPVIPPLVPAANCSNAKRVNDKGRKTLCVILKLEPVQKRLPNGCVFFIPLLNEPRRGVP